MSWAEGQTVRWGLFIPSMSCYIVRCDACPLPPQHAPWCSYHPISAPQGHSRADIGKAPVPCLVASWGRRCLITKLDTPIPVPLPALQGHSRADIRKASVFCLVELWCKLGEALLPHLSALSDAQRKLIDIYFRRACGVA